MELEYFNNLKGQWLEFSKDDVTFDRYYERAIKALDDTFSSQNFTSMQAKNYVNKILAFAQRFPDEWRSDWYASSVKEKFLEELVPSLDGQYKMPLRDKLSKYNGSGLASLAKVALYSLKDVGDGIEAKIVPNPTGIACECPG